MSHTLLFPKMLPVNALASNSDYSFSEPPSPSNDFAASRKHKENSNKYGSNDLKIDAHQSFMIERKKRLLLVPLIMVCLLVCFSYVYIASVAILSGRTVPVSMYVTMGNYDKAIKLAPEDAQLYYMRGQNLYCKQENYDLAIADYRRAVELDEDNAVYWNYVCWNGSIAGDAANVLDACEQAVALLPGNGGVMDSRGLARALIGDYPGAIADFQAFIQWLDDHSLQHDDEVALRQTWIAALEVGQNPFDEATLELLRRESCGE